MANRLIKNGARKLYNKLIHERSRDVFDKKVVGMASGKVDVKDKSQRVWDNDFVLVQLGHVDILSPGLASEGLKVMRLTVRGAFMAFNVFSLCDGSRSYETPSIVFCGNIFLIKILFLKMYLNGRRQRNICY